MLNEACEQRGLRPFLVVIGVLSAFLLVGEADAYSDAKLPGKLPNKRVLSANVQAGVPSSQTTRIGQETSVQIPKPRQIRSETHVRLHIGNDFDSATVGPAAQAEFVSHMNGPLWLLAGIAYHGESKSAGSFKHTLYQAPLLLGAATAIHFTKGWLATFAGGPSYRLAWERATTVEKSESTSALDVFAQIGIEHEWMNDATGSGAAVGLSMHRLFGLSNDERLRPLDSWMVTFGFDL